MKRTLSLIFFLTSLGIIFFQIYKAFNYQNLPLREQLVKAWSQDIQTLESKLPKSWTDVRSIRYLDSDESSLLKSLSPPITLKPSGQSTLEILMTSFQTKDAIYFVIQHYLLDAKSKNLIIELDRTYKINFKNRLSKSKTTKSNSNSKPLPQVKSKSH